LFLLGNSLRNFFAFSPSIGVNRKLSLAQGLLGRGSKLALFMTTSVAPNGSYATREPACRAGDYVELRAEVDCVVVLSSCAHGMSRAMTAEESCALVMSFIPHGG
jgi:hypothetical protein